MPLGDEERSRLRHRTAPPDQARLEEELLAYRSCRDGRDTLLAVS